jgi:protein TonB
MDFARQQRDPTRHLVGITAVVLVHAVVVYALMTGLGTKAIEIIKKPLTATIVEEIKAPPPPPPPPPRKIEIPKTPPPEMPYVPPPDVPVQTVTQEPVIAAVAPTPPPAPPVIAPPAPPAPPPKAAVVRNPTFLNNCAPSMPGEAIRRNIEGSVTAHLFVDEKGSVTDVKIIQADPPRIFDRAVVNAMSTCKFPPSSEKWVAEVPLTFKLQ